MWIGLDPLKHCKVFLFYNMKHKNYLSYKVFENGIVLNSKGVKMIPQEKGNYHFYELSNNGKTFRVCTAKIVLISFEIYPKSLLSRIKFIDGNRLNTSLENLKWN